MSEGPSHRLLVADDEPWVVENLRSLLDWDSLAIEFLEPAYDGEEAMARVEAERPDILVTDINMPFMDGNALIRAAKERYPKIQAIVLSGYADFAYVRDALLHGAIDYLLKPLSKSALLEVLEKALLNLGAGREREREAEEHGRRLRAAASILRDVEMSAILGGEKAEEGEAARSAARELDLEFASFTLVLARLGRRGRPGPAPERLDEEIKSVLSSSAGGARQIAFHNLSLRREYALVADLGSERLARILEELPGRLERRTGMPAAVAASSCYYSLDRLSEAYQETRANLLCRPLGPHGQSGVCGAYSMAGLPEPRRRISPDQENRLTFALESRNRGLAREVIFKEIGLGRCEEEGWYLLEAKQTAEYVAGLIYHRADLGPSASPRSAPAMDNLFDLLSMALEEGDLAEARSVIDQLLDESLGEGGQGGEGALGVARRADAYIREHYFEAISLTSVAEFFRVDSAYLSRAFKQATGTNMMLAIARLRIERAQEYMRRKDLSLTDIAELVGYGEYAYFNRVFRKITGMSPSEYKAAAAARLR
jgi:AraC-like DNA-binding protein/DNA-binding NarL/FixJ family response regulator